MKSRQPIDQFARGLDLTVKESVYKASKLKTEARAEVMERDYGNIDKLRETASQIKQHTLDHLDEHLGRAEKKLQDNGAHVHWAATGEEANRLVLDILQNNGAKKLVKTKSMVSEETGLLPFLEKNGIEGWETDLGEFIVQIGHDRPSHIVTPIIHKNRRQIAELFEREGLGKYNDDPGTITRRARRFLREKYFQADAGLTGANFISAESGRVMLVTNEGNGRFCLAAPRLHIVLAGIEKVIPRDRDLAVFMALLARSSTAQNLSVYTQFINGPKLETQAHGPEEMHVIFLDNGRSSILSSPCRDILRCIRCGACLNVCPVYRQASGHAYRSVYVGPVGAALSPLLLGDRFPELADLPKASSLCGACREVCPVDIPIPDLLLRLRDRAKQERIKKANAGTPPMGGWAILASRPFLWRTVLFFSGLANRMPRELMRLPPPARAWLDSRDLPEFRGGAFRSWMKRRRKQQSENQHERPRPHISGN